MIEETQYILDICEPHNPGVDVDIVVIINWLTGTIQAANTKTETL